MLRALGAALLVAVCLFALYVVTVVVVLSTSDW